MKFLALIITILSISSIFAGEHLPEISTENQRTKGCVTGETLVTLADGSQVEIRQMKRGQSVINTNGKLLKVLNVISGPEKKLIYKITFSNGSVVNATNAHPFISLDGMFILSKELSAGSKIKSKDGVVEVSSVTLLSAEQSVYNLILVDENMYLNADKNISLKTVNGSILSWAQVLRKNHPFLGLSDEDHTFFINGIESGDLIIQSSLLQ